MKKLAIALLVALLLPLVACADNLISVSDLRAQVEASGGRWTQTYKTNDGETITVDVPVEIPEVDVFPILKASWMARMPEQISTDYDPVGDKKDDRWLACSDRYGLLAVNHDWDFAIGPNESTKGLKWVAEDLMHDGSDWNQAYAYNNDLRVGEAFEFIKQAVKEVYARYDMPYDDPFLNHITLDNILRGDTPLREKGSYTFSFYESLRGIPVLASEGKGCNKLNPYMELSVISVDSYKMLCQLYRETELLAEDVPLLPFDSIKPVFEDLINKGKLKNVFFVRLGYIALYETGKIDDEVYRLIPCWVLTGEYYESKKEAEAWKELSKEADEQGVLLLGRGSTQKIIVNAQTGKIIPQDASNKENQKQFNVKKW